MPVASAIRRGGENSATTVRQIGIRPPRPRPARKRLAPNWSGSPASAQTPDPAENSSTHQTSTVRLPIQSVMLPAVSAPMSMPKVVQLPILPAAEASRPKAVSSSMYGMTAP